MLFLIQKKLNIGKVRIYDHFASFDVTKKKDLIHLINIFDQYPLNTTKHLNFLVFKEAFNLYQEFKSLYKDRGVNSTQTELDKQKLFKKILDLKNKMNRQRTNFKLPNDHKIIITPY